jgi:hypothetical protein
MKKTCTLLQTTGDKDETENLRQSYRKTIINVTKHKQLKISNTDILGLESGKLLIPVFLCRNR